MEKAVFRRGETIFFSRDFFSVAARAEMSVEPLNVNGLLGVTLLFPEQVIVGKEELLVDKRISMIIDEIPFVQRVWPKHFLVDCIRISI